jgi:4-hydroxyphenylacetate 3-monooxygenase
VAFQRELAVHDLALTHTIVHPTVDKSLPETAGGDGEVCLHKVDESEHGIVVSGARALATLAPVADELAVYPGQPLPPDAGAYALAFSIPIDTPGLTFLCRDSYAATGSRFDHPFSTRFDEHDAVVLFDRVEVPRHRVFLDGDADVYNKVMAAGWVANIMQQTSIRAAVKLEFAYELLTRLADAVGATDPGTNQLLGEVWTYWELTRAAIAAAEAGAYEWGNGTWFCDERPFRALRPTLPGWFPRVNEIFKLVGAHNLLTTPTEAELRDPALRPLLDKHYQGAKGFPAEERIRLFRAAWDFAGTGLAGRNELYERFYLASAVRMYQVAHMGAKRERARSVVDMVLAPGTVTPMQAEQPE